MEQAYPYAQSSDVETEIICDTEHNHYQLSYVGWDDQKRILILSFTSISKIVKSGFNTMVQKPRSLKS